MKSNKVDFYLRSGHIITGHITTRQFDTLWGELASAKPKFGFLRLDTSNTTEAAVMYADIVAICYWKDQDAGND